MLPKVYYFAIFFKSKSKLFGFRLVIGYLCTFYYSVFNNFFDFYYLIYKQIDQENNSSVGAITGEIRGSTCNKAYKS